MVTYNVKKPSDMLVEFTSYTEFKELSDDDPRNDRGPLATHLEAMFFSMVGLVMPITITMVTPVPPAKERTPELQAMLDIAKALGDRSGKLITGCIVSHRELDGFPLSVEYLPMIAKDNLSKTIARRMAGSGTTNTNSNKKEHNDGSAT